MKISYRVKASRFVAGAALFSALGFNAPVTAKEYPRERAYFIDLDNRSVTALGSLGGGHSDAGALNDSGQVVGSSSSVAGSYHAFISGPNGKGMRDLGTLGGADSVARGINNTGEVVGESNGRAFITGPNGIGMRDLNIPDHYSNASSVNNAGQVVGVLSSEVLDFRSFITGPNGVGRTILGTLGGTMTWVRNINDEGRVVGYSFTWGGPPTYEGVYHGFITGPNGIGMKDLGTLGDESSTSDAIAINNIGQVAGGTHTGYMREGVPAYHAFITGPDGVGMKDLGTLSGDESHAFGINDAGQVVGRSDTSSGASHAFITGPNGEGITDLNSLVDLPQGVILTRALDINNAGQVIAMGIPEPQTYALMLAGLGLVGLMARRKRLA
jgi:probable HAF family extracellular repeat protein